MSYESVNLNEKSIVHWFKCIEMGHRCGYCKSQSGSVSFGMWAETLTVDDYQNLIDRGWRRSGLYCYKPVMDQTCCPQYTIRCEALKLSLTKSQKKVIKKFNKFLSDGILNKNDTSQNQDEDQDCGVSGIDYVPDLDISNVSTNCKEIVNQLGCDEVDLDSLESDATEAKSSVRGPENCIEKGQIVNSEPSRALKAKLSFKEGKGADPDKPKCKKAKLLRLERKKLKTESQEDEVQNATQKQNTNVVKTLEQFLSEVPKNGKHKLRLKLIPTSKPGAEWKETEEIEYELYKKYQTIVHNDKDISLKGFKRFLVTSPLKPKPFSINPNSNVGFGSYHQQYWLNDKLIGVGVIDILPKCISSVYFFYDPDYRNLTLGTYGSLKEVHFTRQLHDIVPSIQYYYMGFYIHSCPKMRYKGKLVPSYLLCPESYSWIRIEECIPKLNASKYSRLNSELDALDIKQCTSHDVDMIMVLADYVCMYYKTYKRKYRPDDMFNNIGNLIGKTARNIVFIPND